MVSPPIRGDNARALACVLSPVHVDNHDTHFAQHTLVQTARGWVRPQTH